MAGFDINQIDNNRKGLVATGFLAFIFTFLPFYGWSGGGLSFTWNAWHSWAVIASLLVIVALAASVVVALGLVELPKLPVSWNFAIAGVALLALILFALRALTWPSFSVPGGSLGLRWGGYVLMILLAAQTVFAVLAARAAGEKLEWDMPKSGSPGAGTPESNA